MCEKVTILHQKRENPFFGINKTQSEYRSARNKRQKKGHLQVKREEMYKKVPFFHSKTCKCVFFFVPLYVEKCT